ncbi:beta-galactosidase [Sphingomonas sp. RB3P16]|uniref:beta-galactosidase n=1 Tax=Parasphingomonas frigoris TaxID=3096163 RepID=UPI002FC8B654
MMKRFVAPVWLALLATPAVSQQVVQADASAPIDPVKTGFLQLGTATSPRGDTLDVNDRYLTLNHRPWLPVMGEIHFVRLPRDEWRAELLKMKASGVDIVATYLFWNYHEATQGQFDWSGDRDVRAFVKLADEIGLKVLIRLGPWAHGEARFGGIPDWVVRTTPTRGSDPTYLQFVDRYWGEIGRQLQGELWKDGGPIIGVQLENEYNLTGALEGRRHIADLKAIALKHGFDVPFYTVTGWDGTIYPARAVTPVFGGYPDEPWGTTVDKLPPKETYAFRFDSRVSGNLGAQTQGASGDAERDTRQTPFLGAEYGAGVPTMYRRRPVIQPDDIAAMLPVQLGSGVNLYGYYMYHGGRNLVNGTTLEESTAIGGFNDLPAIEYDFQAPYGEYGEANPVVDYLRPFHAFLHSYGALLAPMTVRRPAAIPSGNDDLRTLRWSVRAAGSSAFVFVNTHVRQYRMAPQAPTQFAVKLGSRDVVFPSLPVAIPSGAYFIWPIGLDLGGSVLDWASAQPVTRLDTAEGPVHVFAATDGIVPEFAFARGTLVRGGQARDVGDATVVTVTRPGTDAVLRITGKDGVQIRILVLSQDQSRHLSRISLAGKEHLLFSRAELVEDGQRLALTSVGDPHFALSLWPALPGGAHGTLALARAGMDGMFTRYTATAPLRTMSVTFRRTRAPGVAPPIAFGGNAKAAIEPYPEIIANTAGSWSLDLPHADLAGLDDATLSLGWVGDIGRLYRGTELVDDRFFDGRNWRIGLKRILSQGAGPLSLRILPLRSDAPIYLDAALRPKPGPDGQRADLLTAAIEPRYRLEISVATAAQ